jgi:hypothetical protein
MSAQYIPGDFYRICDRCGSKFRASQTYRTWDGLFVCAEDFETRHPQDFVRGTKDLQNVPDPRPEALETIIGPLQTAIRTAAATAATTINVDSSVRFFATDTIGVMLDSGNMERHVVGSVPTATSIILAVGLGSAASVGNVVINYSAVSLADIG